MGDVFYGLLGIAIIFGLLYITYRILRWFFRLIFGKNNKNQSVNAKSGKHNPSKKEQYRPISKELTYSVKAIVTIDEESKFPKDRELTRKEIKQIFQMPRYNIEYVDANGVVTERDITPVSVSKQSKNNLIYAFCHLRHEMRHFKESGIQKCSGKHGEIYSPAAYFKKVLDDDFKEDIEIHNQQSEVSHSDPEHLEGNEFTMSASDILRVLTHELKPASKKKSYAIIDFDDITYAASSPIITELKKIIKEITHHVTRDSEEIEKLANVIDEYEVKPSVDQLKMVKVSLEQAQSAHEAIETLEDSVDFGDNDIAYDKFFVFIEECQDKLCELISYCEDIIEAAQ